jgi:DNA polymerase-3 subunit gamma/tau
MSNFIVSARKYRPTRFEDVVGQQHVSQTLKNALQTDHLAHAFLFCGPRGVGKTTCARILAKVLNCQNVSDDFEPCNTCSSCQSFNENASFNITELDAASNNSVEHIRALIEQVRFQPQQGKYKVFIIDEVHMLSNQAFNAFLKTLEEPPPYAIFILATTEKHKIIPTILSRCQIFDFKRIQIPDMIDHLQSICDSEGIKAEPDALHIIAQKADGALRDALSIFDRMVSFSGDKITYQGVIDNLNVLDYDYYFRFVDAMLSEQLPLVLEIFNEVLNKGFEGDLFINGLGEHLRNLLVARDSRTLPLLEVGDALRDRYQQQGAMAPPSFILTALNLANECDVHYKTARNKRLHVEMALIKMTYILRAVDAGQMVQRAEPSVEKKTVVGSSEQSSVGSRQSVISHQSSVVSVSGQWAVDSSGQGAAFGRC